MRIFVILLLLSFYSFGYTAEVDPDNVADSTSKNASFNLFKELENSKDHSAQKQYIEICYPHLCEEQREKALEIFSKIAGEKNSPIEEDDDETQESGFSFPPHMEVQGPFLLELAKKKVNRVLDIGPGSGNDTIMALLTQRAQVIAVDIHKKQLAAFRKRVFGMIKEFPDLATRCSVFCRDFSAEGSVPEKYLRRFQVVNANKILHFLDEEETRILIKNVHAMLEDGGLFHITVTTPTLPYEAPGVVYYQTERLIGGMGVSQISSVSKEKSRLKGPRYKREDREKILGGSMHVHTQGRHFHTKETLQKYLTPYFEFIDVTQASYGPGDLFVSVIAQKKSVSGKEEKDRKAKK